MSESLEHVEQTESGSQDYKDFLNTFVENGGIVSSNSNRNKENVLGRDGRE